MRDVAEFLKNGLYLAAILFAAGVAVAVVLLPSFVMAKLFGF